MQEENNDNLVLLHSRNCVATLCIREIIFYTFLFQFRKYFSIAIFELTLRDVHISAQVTTYFQTYQQLVYFRME